MMPLKTLLSQTAVTKVQGSLDREVASICFDSRWVSKDDLFVALRGEHFDGHHYVPEAVSRGAAAVLIEEPPSGLRAVEIQVPDTRRALAEVSVAFHGNPSSAMKVAGVTGTNGKTTVAFLLQHLCDTSFLRCGLVGTVHYAIADRILPAARTTPESSEIQHLLAQMRDAGCKAVAMEVSSHALAQDRVRGVEFDVAIFTNLSQDHLDYHRTMEEYFEAKARLFEQMAGAGAKKPVAVVNVDDRYGVKLAERFEKRLRVLTYGVSSRAEFKASNIRTEPSGLVYQLDARKRSYLVRSPLIGRFNVSNTLAAMAGAVAMGVGVRHAVQGLANAPQVPGRLQAMGGKRNFQVFVDYAHTPDALANVLKTLRELVRNSLIVVFGCGGNRDRGKRAKMGAVADEWADFIVLTHDNPRKEDPETILKDIESGIKRRPLEVIPDRREAIYRAVEIAEPGDMVLIAGKGHETSQEFADHTVPFSDCQEAAAAMQLKSAPVEDRS